MTTTYVVTAEQGIIHNDRFYQKDERVLLDARSAAYHVRNQTVVPLVDSPPPEAVEKATRKSKGGS